MALCLIIPVTFPLIQNLGIEIQRAKNKHQARGVVYFFIALGNIFLSIPLIKTMGPVGAALGTAISLIIGNIVFMNWYYYKRIGLEIPSFWKSIFSFVKAFVLPVLVGLLMMRYVNIRSWSQLIFWALIYALVFLVSMCFFGMNNSEKTLFINLRKKIAHK